MKNAKRKLLIYGTITVSLVMIFVFIVSAFAAAFAAVLAGASTSKKIDVNSYESAIEVFDITGSYNEGTYDLNFIFSSFSIKNIKGSNEINQTVKVPALNGEYEEIVYKFFRQNGYTHEGTCGIMGCLWAESNFEPCSIEGDNFWTEDKSSLARGYGICQWTNTTAPYINGRRTDIINYLKRNGYSPYKSSKKLLQGQLKYILIEDGYSKARNSCKTTTSIAKATEYWLRYYERAYTASYYSKRLDKAKEYDKKYKNYDFKVAKDSLEEVQLKITLEKDNSKVVFSGTLDGIDIAGGFTVNEGKVQGTGYYGDGASVSSNIDGIYIGCETSKNTAQRNILKSVSKWSNPYMQGYSSMCEAWVARVYTDAGLSYNGACCASKSRDKNAIKTGKIPVGAVIYSGTKYKSSVSCTCGRNAGHVAIYIGDGLVAGSQIPFNMQISDWINTFGYGGWSFAGNTIK